MKVHHHSTKLYWSCIVLLSFLNTPSPAQLHTSAYDTPSMIDFESTEVSVSEAGTNAILHLFRTGEFRTVSRVDYQTYEETASEGSDYRGSGGTLVFQPGEGYKTIQIPILIDEENEELETFRIELSASDGRIIIVRNMARVTIQESTNTIAGVPQLEIQAREDETILISWARGSSAFVLERASSCSKPIWERVPAEPVLNGSRYEVSQKPEYPFQIFRLHGE